MKPPLVALETPRHALEVLLIEQGTGRNERFRSNYVTFICGFVKSRPITKDHRWSKQKNQEKCVPATMTHPIA
jgi:hypothetical protein